jgi:hypothetical protein
MKIKTKAAPQHAEKKSISPWVPLILAVAFLTYSVTIGFGFAYDDSLQIVHNQRIQSAEFLPSYFTYQVWAQAQGQPENLYRPLFMSWLLANFEAFGLWASGWHLTAILMHLMVTVLVYMLSRKLIPGDAVAALIAAAVFALHPSHVEAVAWISGVTEPLSAAFFLGSFLCYLEYRQQMAQRTTWLAASLTLFAAAMLIKETAIVLPAVIACYELCSWNIHFRPNQLNKSWRDRRESLAVLVPYVLLAGMYLGARALVLHGLAHRISDLPLRTSLLTLPAVLYFYFTQLLVPIGLGPFYDVDYASGISISGVVLPLFVLLTVALGVWWWSRKARCFLPVFLGGWFLLTLAPALAVFVIMSRYENVHDRYLYLPSVGIVILAGYGFSRLFSTASARVLWQAATIVLITALGFASYRQALYWENDLALFTRGCAVAPRNLLAKLNLSAELTRNHRFEGAFVVAQQAIDLDSNSALALSAAAQAAYYLGNYTTSENYYTRALALASPRVDQLYYLGMSRIEMGRFREGLEPLQKGLSLWPNSPGYHYGLGRAFAGMGDWIGARDNYNLELALYPSSMSARGALQEAEAHLQSTAKKTLPARTPPDLPPVKQ